MTTKNCYKACRKRAAPIRFPTHHIPQMHHWENYSDAALGLAGAVENDHGGKV
ncbi:MAG: hypothetical protein JW786_11185 [Desulfobacterales bacterium]|nr:hypothetical protein [Desulfobacterales bacterium]